MSRYRTRKAVLPPGRWKSVRKGGEVVGWLWKGRKSWTARNTVGEMREFDRHSEAEKWLKEGET